MVAYRKQGPIGLNSDLTEINIAKQSSRTYPGMHSSDVSLRGSLGIEETMTLKPYINSFVTKKTPRGIKVLKFFTKWGRNASPFTTFYNYYKLNKAGFSFLSDVRKSAETGRNIINNINKLEGIAVDIKKVTSELYSAYNNELPKSVLKYDNEVGHIMVTQSEMNHIEMIYNSTVLLADDALNAEKHLDKLIKEWDGVLAQANEKKDFTRKALWEAITMLELRFSNKVGGSFRGYLNNARNEVNVVKVNTRNIQYLAGDILGKPVPSWYQAPASHILK